MDNEDSHNENWLKGAVDKLRSQGVIKRDKEIAERTGYSPESVSNMISGKVNVSDKFKRKFQESFKEELSKLVKHTEYSAELSETSELKDKLIMRLEEVIHLQQKEIQMVNEKFEKVNELYQKEVETTKELRDKLSKRGVS